MQEAIKQPELQTEQPLLARFFPNNEWVLLAVLLFEICLFSITGNNFLSTGNGFDITRLAVEIGLFVLVMTPIIITVRIDLSVGSMMSLSAVVLGGLWRDANVPLPLAIIITLLIGTFGGYLNGIIITKLRFPPLIVTLGTFSLFRGVAEGLTRGIENYSGFSPNYLFLGQGYIFGAIPTQLIIFIIAIFVIFWMLQRTAFGRSLYAIGYSQEGARHAGIKVRRSLTTIYTLSGLMSSLAAVIYVAHLGQAKSDAGTGYELMAITAVVLGGASIFGGRGTILGTVLGLFAIVILQNGLRLSGLPTELAGILTGVLLVAVILFDRFSKSASSIQKVSYSEEEFEVKNSQVGFICAAIVLTGLLIAGSNWMLVSSIRQGGSATTTTNSSSQNASQNTPPSGKKVVIGMMPKAKGDPYFISCKKGADEAAKELGAELLWDGPTDLDPAKQNEVVEAWITRGVDAIAVSVENKEAISTVLKKAKDKGIKVVTWDADSNKDARDFLINQATPQGIGETLTDEAARILGGKGEFAIVTASLSAANQNEWIKYIKERLNAKYPDIKLVAIQPSDGDRDRAFQETQNILKVHPNVKLIMGIAAPAVPGIAEAVKQSGKKDVKVTGLSLPNMCKPYIKEGIVDSIVLWNTGDLGYLSVYAANALVNNKLKQGDKTIEAGKLKSIEVVGDEVRLGKPFIFNKDNVDNFDF
ncbi:MAG TPA: substrate-binding domain-containing protein [Pyrinomonadaceae bacterium]|nr:substrate-binding domain-containing protein [Pyrinomonadaceae bacterium]